FGSLSDAHGEAGSDVFDCMTRWAAHRSCGRANGHPCVEPGQARRAQLLGCVALRPVPRLVGAVKWGDVAALRVRGVACAARGGILARTSSWRRRLRARRGLEGVCAWGVRSDPLLSRGDARHCGGNQGEARHPTGWAAFSEEALAPRLYWGPALVRSRAPRGAKFPGEPEPPAAPNFAAGSCRRLRPTPEPFPGALRARGEPAPPRKSPAGTGNRRRTRRFSAGAAGAGFWRRRESSPHAGAASGQRRKKSKEANGRASLQRPPRAVTRRWAAPRAFPRFARDERKRRRERRGAQARR
ncbi:uncharacterized protein Tco025E_10130, partial [Trypanosoma conorhini]